MTGGGLRHWSTPLDPPSVCKQPILSQGLPTLGKALAQTFGKSSQRRALTLLIHSE